MTDMTHSSGAHAVDPDAVPAPGRPVRLVPVAPGFWMVAIGVVIAALAPLFGFLVGVMSGRPVGETAAISPLYWGLFSGVVIGGLGVVLALAGGYRLIRHRAAARQEG